MPKHTIEKIVISVEIEHTCSTTNFEETAPRLIEEALKSWRGVKGAKARTMIRMGKETVKC